MTLRGTIRNGRVELDHVSSMPDGTHVEVTPSKSESLMDLFRRNAIRDPSIPKDYAAEIDHYLYGLPKRNGKATKKAGTRGPRTKVKAKSSAKKRTRKAGR